MITLEELNNFSRKVLDDLPEPPQTTLNGLRRLPIAYRTFSDFTGSNNSIDIVGGLGIHLTEHDYVSVALVIYGSDQTLSDSGYSWRNRFIALLTEFWRALGTMLNPKCQCKAHTWQGGNSGLRLAHVTMSGALIPFVGEREPLSWDRVHVFPGLDGVCVCCSRLYDECQCGFYERCHICPECQRCESHCCCLKYDGPLTEIFAKVRAGQMSEAEALAHVNRWGKVQS